MSEIHRYFGLAIAVFLTVAGLTGSILAFDTDLDAWLNPELFEAKASGPILPPSEIAKSVEKLDPRVIAAWIPLVVEPGESALVWISTEHDPATGDHYQVGFNQVFVEPSTGEILGKREWGAFSVAKQDLIPFIYVLHYSLHIPSSVGLWIMGIVAIVWIFDCFIGAYLTFPRGRPFLAKWKPAWLIKFGASGHRDRVRRASRRRALVLGPAARHRGERRLPQPAARGFPSRGAKRRHPHARA